MQESMQAGMQPLVRAILAEPDHQGEMAVAIRQGRRYVRTLVPINLPCVSQINLPCVSQVPSLHQGVRPSHVAFRHQGVYVILGGAGGIGLELSRYLAETVQARLVLIGRSEELRAEQREKIARIESKGGKVLYIGADATDIESMRAAIARAKEHFGSIHGVIHSAIVLKDRALENMDEQTFRAALAPKCRGSVILHKVLQDEPLDFMLFFSSAQSFLSNAGQSNYAAACTFKDAYALYLDQIRAYPVKVINWGYWGSVGIVADEEYNSRLAAQGIGSIEPEEGMEAIQRVLGQQRLSQLIAIKAQNSFLKAVGVDLQQRIEPYPESIPSLIEALSHEALPHEALSHESLSHEALSHEALSHEALPLNRGAQPANDAQMPDDAQVPDNAQLPDNRNERSQFQRACKELERYGRLLLIDAFQRMGVFQSSGEHYRKDQLRDQLKIAPGYFRLYEAVLDILIKAGFIQLEGEDIVTTHEVENKDQRGDLTDQGGGLTDHFTGQGSDLTDQKSDLTGLGGCRRKKTMLKIPPTPFIKGG